MNELPEIDLSDAVIARLIQWARQQAQVRAMLLTSTRANPHASVDILSDYDIILVVQDIYPFFEDRTWLQDFGRVLVAYWDPIHPAPGYDLERVASVIQYEDGLKIDFTLWPVALLQRIVQEATLPAGLDVGYAILVDKDRLTDGLPDPTYSAYIPTPPTNEIFHQVIEDFFSDAPYVAKCLWRDELLPAKWCLDYDMKHNFLRQMLEWRLECDHHWAVPVGALGKDLKKRLPPEIWSHLERTYTGAEIAENWEALFQTIALFRRVATEVAAHLGYTYPQDLDRRVVAYLQHLKGLTPQAKHTP